jgi:hypothetical protein
MPASPSPGTLPAIQPWLSQPSPVATVGVVTRGKRKSIASPVMTSTAAGVFSYGGSILPFAEGMYPTSAAFVKAAAITAEVGAPTTAKPATTSAVVSAAATATAAILPTPTPIPTTSSLASGMLLSSGDHRP